MTFSLGALITFVVLALVIGLVAWVLTIVVARSPFDEAIKQVVTWAIFAIAVILVLVALLQAFGLIQGGPILQIGK